MSSRLDDLIKEKCPNGVKMYTLGELGTFYGGLTGKSKNDFVDGNAKFITYKNVYSNPALCLDVEDRVKIAEGEKQRTLEYGDVVFTGSSETPDECGFSSVVTTKTDEKLYLNSFCFFFRLNNPELLLPDFAKHLFRSDNLRYQIGKTASGVTRFNVSKERMKSVKIPVPPLEVQNEIVQILDNFAELTAELTAELSNRKKQYEYYKEFLFSNLDSTAVSTKEVSVDRFWLMPATPCYISEGIPYITSKNIKDGQIILDDIKYISEDDYENISKNRSIKENDLLITMIGTIGETALVGKETKFYGQNIYLVRMDESRCLSKYFQYFLSMKKIRDKLISKKNASSQGYIKAGSIDELKFPLPPIHIQKKIVDILDKFSALNSSMLEGLPAEINARKKQYSYYSNKLLTFKEAK